MCKILYNFCIVFFNVTAVINCSFGILLIVISVIEDSALTLPGPFKLASPCEAAGLS